VDVPAFAVGQHKVTNGEYLEFVGAGAPAPHFWICHEGRWFYRGMFADIPLPLDWPVYVAYEQARAYAAWKGKVLLTEAQFHRAAYPADEKGTGDLTRENVDFRSWDPVPVNATEPNGFGVSQMIGNGWEWTATRFEPFPGFEPFPWYPGYSANFLRWRALRFERRLAAHRRTPAAIFIPQLVPSGVPISVRHFPFG
jgi:iron(II)-dependent oxidoreductase